MKKSHILSLSINFSFSLLILSKIFIDNPGIPESDLSPFENDLELLLYIPSLFQREVMYPYDYIVEYIGKCFKYMFSKVIIFYDRRDIYQMFEIVRIKEI